MDQAVIDFVQGSRIAVVGASSNSAKFGNMAFKELKQRGYQVFPVNPNAQEIEGQPCYASLAELRGQVDGALVVVQPQHAVQVLREAAEAGIRNVWLQQGSESDEALSAAQALGLNAVSKKCILMYAQPVKGVHGLHRGLVRLFGRL